MPRGTERLEFVCTGWRTACGQVRLRLDRQVAFGPWWDVEMTEPWHVEVVPLPAHDGWLLRCIERPEVVMQLATLDDMGATIADAIAKAVGRQDTLGMAISFSYPLGDVTLYRLTRETDGTISCDQVPGLRLNGASRTQDLVHAISVADGVPADMVGIVSQPR